MTSHKAACEIRNFVELLEKSLTRKILAYTLTPLTKPGENYGSVMQLVEVKVVKNDSNQSENFCLVSKTPISNPYLAKIFQPAVTFVKEVRFYTDIVDAIKHFEKLFNVPKTERIDSLIQCLGSRVSLDPDARCADADAVLLLENIIRSGYRNKDRAIGFDTEESMAILKSLAQFHAIFIAMRRLKPQLFEEKVKPHLEAVNLVIESDGTKLFDKNLEDLKFVENIDSKLRNEIERSLKIGFDFTKDTTPAKDTPYTTICHRDLWVNNIMISKDVSSKQSIKVKIYDFQLYFYQSFVHDLILFLFTSVCCSDLAMNFKSLINCYHSEFTKTLKSVNCPSDDYTFDKMWNEIRKRAKTEMLHVFVLSKLCMVEEHSAPSLDTISSETFFKDEPPSKAILNRWKFMIDMFQANGFI